MPRISSPRPLDLTKPFVTSSQFYGAQPFDLSQNLVTWYRDIQGNFVPDLSGRGNNARCAGSGSHDRVTGSNDIPEHNSLNYPLQSFDLSDNATLTSNVQHIRTVNSLGATSALDDHTFTDNLGDVPLSISFWIKLDSTSATQYIAAKGFVASNAEWSIHIDNTNRITFRLNSQGSASNYIESRKTSAFTGTHSGWDYFVLTYDGSETSAGIKIYRNGSDVGTPNSLGSYSGMQNTNYAVCIGSFFSNSNYTPSASDVRGKIHSFAIWKNRALSSSEISALYNAYLNGPGGEARSGFISRSPRLMLRELDDLPGSYPTVRRTGDPTRTGALSSNFNDETAIVFSNAGNVVFPTMLPKGSSFASQAVDIIGQESDISASLPIRSFQQPNHLHYSPTEAVGPFDENRVMPATDFFLSGTDPDIIPSFTSPIRSKIAIDIDITPQSDTLVMRNVDRRTVAEGGASIGDQTGFLYYNFARKEWEQIGLIDPATKNSRYFDFAYNSTAGSVSGTFPSQFSASPGIPFVEKYELATLTRRELGYSKIGTPSVVMGAPNVPLYHATQSQSLRMSDYISQPFFLEAIQFEFGEVNAQRVQGNVPSNITDDPDIVGISTVADLVASGALKDIDNYVFFAYRQKRNNRIVDSAADVSSSIRSLIFSSSLCFWNSASLGVGDSSTLLHSPSFDYEFGLPYNNTFAVGSFTGSIEVSLKPGVLSPSYLGSTATLSTRASLSDTNVTTLARFNYWPGGTSNANFPGINPSQVLGFEGTANYGSSIGKIASDFGRLDPRPVRKFGGETVTPTVDAVFSYLNSTNNASSNDSPYLLMPEDELVFGLEAGTGVYFFQQSFGALTGSFLRINASPCKVRLFGSLVSDGKESNLSLNQNLSSDSVHEIVGAEPVLDQFQIETVSSYYGSRLEEIVTGSMLTPILDGVLFSTASQDQSRRVVSRVSLGQAGSTGSLQRFMKLSDRRERTYDSCLPSYAGFFSGDSRFSVFTTDTVLGVSTENHEIVKWVSGSVDDGMFEIGSFFKNQFPFQNNPERQLALNGSLTSGSTINGGLYTSDISQFRDYANYSTYKNYTNFKTVDWAYRVGYSFTNVYEASGFDRTYVASHREIADDVGLFLNPNYSLRYGTFRYGISNVAPEFSSSRWRSDRYGQLRDTLEQRQLVATFDGLKPIKISFVSGSTKVDPMLTYSQNLSTFATSSMPYFDDNTARNRPDNPDESLVEVIA